MRIGTLDGIRTRRSVYKRLDRAQQPDPRQAWQSPTSKVVRAYTIMYGVHYPRVVSSTLQALATLRTDTSDKENSRILRQEKSKMKQVRLKVYRA